MFSTHCKVSQVTWLKSLGKDATLSDILQMLDENYGVVMMFNTLIKELYSLKQGSGGNVAEFGVHLTQQVQILQSEYLGRIQPKHMEEMKCDCFYEGLGPKNQWMLAHKVDGKNPAGYSDLLLAVQKLERRAEAKDPLPPKTAVASGLKATCSQVPGNLFPSCRLKENCTFTAWAATIEMMKVKQTPAWSKEGEGDTEPSANEEVEALGRTEETDQPMKYIICFAKAVELHQQKNRSCFRCGSPNHLMQDCPKDMSKSAWKADLNNKGGTAKKGGGTPQKPVAAQQTSPV